MMHVLEAMLALGGPLAARSYSESDGGSWMLLLLGPAAGIAFYMAIYFRYRNTNRRHAYERETASQVLDLRVHDRVVGNVTGVQRTSIEGANGSSPRTRLGQGTTVSVATPEPPVGGGPQPPAPGAPPQPA